MRRFLLLILFASLPLHARCWGQKGHATIGAIADKNLTAQAKTAVFNLLSDDRTWTGTKSGRTTLEDVANWADEIRNDHHQDYKKPWHYHNNAVCAPHIQSCADGNCISSKLPQMIATLRNKTASTRKRNEALKLVVHLVGDLHQPLHVGDNHDHGGNLLLVALSDPSFNDSTNLHSAWDKDFVEQAGSIDIEALPHPPVGFQDDEIASWAEESRLLALHYGYRPLPGFACQAQSPRGVIMLSKPYQNDAAKLAKERITLAGQRLAAVLNTVFAN